MAIRISIRRESAAPSLANSRLPSVYLYPSPSQFSTPSRKVVFINSPCLARGNVNYARAFQSPPPLPPNVFNRRSIGNRGATIATTSVRRSASLARVPLARPVRACRSRPPNRKQLSSLARPCEINAPTSLPEERDESRPGTGEGTFRERPKTRSRERETLSPVGGVPLSSRRVVLI